MAGRAGLGVCNCCQLNCESTLASRRRCGGSDPSEQCSCDHEKTHKCDEPRSQSVLSGSPGCRNHAAMLGRPGLACSGALWAGGGRLFQSGPCPTQLFVPLELSWDLQASEILLAQRKLLGFGPSRPSRGTTGLPRSRLQPRLSRCRFALGMRDRVLRSSSLSARTRDPSLSIVGTFTGSSVGCLTKEARQVPANHVAQPRGGSILSSGSARQSIYRELIRRPSDFDSVLTGGVKSPPCPDEFNVHSLSRIIRHGAVAQITGD